MSSLTRPSGIHHEHTDQKPGDYAKNEVSFCRFNRFQLLQEPEVGASGSIGVLLPNNFVVSSYTIDDGAVSLLINSNSWNNRRQLVHRKGMMGPASTIHQYARIQRSLALCPVSPSTIVEIVVTWITKANTNHVTVTSTSDCVSACRLRQAIYTARRHQ